MNNEVFKPKANILVLLGEELIKSPVMAIYELIKNSYDADAKEVDIVFKNIEDLNDAQIVIKDNGLGITEDVLRNVWFEPGTDHRKPLDESGIRQVKRSPIFGRIPMGEKGVGRFAVHKLGNMIKLTSRPAKVIIDEEENTRHIELLNYEITVEIDWRKFSQDSYLSDVLVTWQVNENINEFVFPDSHGTMITISGLKEPWTRGMARNLKRQTLSMISPRNDINQFKLNLDFGNFWLVDFPSIDKILDDSPYKVVAFLDEQYNLTFDYTFSLKNNPSLGSRRINELPENASEAKKFNRNIKDELQPYLREYLEKKEFDRKKIDVLIRYIKRKYKKIPFGSFMLDMSSFDLDSTSIKDYSNDVKLPRSILRDNAGIKVFKENMRVFDYGDPGNDWLGLDIKRINNKTWFSNNQNIGFVYLDDEKSKILVEKTNREGFIENEPFEIFKFLLEFVLNEFRIERNVDREKWLQFNQKLSGDSFEEQLSKFRQTISDASLSEEERKSKLIEEAKSIEFRYKTDRDTLMIPAGVGMTASFAMHEIEKLVPRLEEAVHVELLNRNLLISLIDELKDYTEGILSILKKGRKGLVKVEEIINQAFHNYSTRLDGRNISYEIDNVNDQLAIDCDKRIIITLFMNLVDNSMSWLDSIYKPNKKILVKTKETDNNIHIYFIDNGPGFKDSAETLVRPYFTRKEHGIGIGLYLIDTIMIQYGKLLLYNIDSNPNLNLPEDMTGAVVELIFKKNNEDI
ncbi:MAG: ATP-binding protein [Fluviicola sp.]